MRRNRRGYRVGQDACSPWNIGLVDNCSLAAIYYVLTSFLEIVVSERNHRIKDIAGRRFGRLTVLSLSHCNGKTYWACRCDCGAERLVDGCSLRSGNTKSCGCLLIERATKHGQSDTPTYLSWLAMRSRCQNVNASNYGDYGARGVCVCDRWNSFPKFLADMGERPEGTTLDRHPDPTGNYEPGNCRWATASEQNSNKRATRLYEMNGEKLLLRALADRYGIGYDKLQQRLNRRGWSVQRAISTP